MQLSRSSLLGGALMALAGIWFVAVPVSVNAVTMDTTGVSIYTAVKYNVTQVTYGGGTFSTDTVTGDAYEGKRCIKYNYNLVSYWDMISLTTHLLNVTGATGLRFAIKGTDPSVYVEVTLGSQDGGSAQNIGHTNLTTDWSVVDMGLDQFNDAVDSVGNDKGVNYSKFDLVRFDIYNGSTSGSGTLYLDDIILVNAVPAGVVKHLSNGSIAAKATPKALTDGPVDITVYRLDGSMLSRNVVEAKAGTTLSLDAVRQSAMPRGTYVVAMKGAGIDLRNTLTK